MAAWLAERAAAYLEEIQRLLPREELVLAEDLGIERCRYGMDF